jgi:serine/threonine protein kinase/tetratricopeptide (TPR) repeat protein
LNNDSLLDLAAAVADGTSVDWESAADSAIAADDPRLLAELQFIAEIVQLRRASTLSSDPAVPGALGSQWGPLRIIEHVGRGTFGDVYRAWDGRLDREVALKILRHRERDEEARDSTAIEEGRLLGRVRHPNIVTVYGAERVNGQVGVWMEFIHGRTLEQELHDQGPFDVDRVIKIGLELADALSTVHRAGLIHRDVKAHNVILDPDGRLTLTDFGAGCELEESSDGARELAGTPLCVAPEVLAGEAATPRSDIYSLGVLLYHLVTGTYPVRGRSLKDVREAHVRGTRTPLRTARPDLPSAFVGIVDRALDPDPNNRYDSPGTLKAELASLAAVNRGEPAAAAIGTSRKWRYGAGAVILAFAAGFGSLALWRSAETPTIAVLPLKNLSAEPDSEYFVDGLTDEIIRNLSEIEGLEVRSSTSSFTFKNRPRNLAEVGQQLDANFVVEGSVLRSGDKLRVNVQFVRVPYDAPIWSARFDRDLEDIFTIQDEISQSIVNELRLKLGRGQRRYHAKLEAYEVYLKARALIYPHSGAPDARLGAELLEQVIAKDPAFAPAHAGLVDAWAVLSINYASVSPNVALARMEPAAKRVLELDPLLAEAHAAMGVVLGRKREWKASEAAFRRAIDLNRHLPSVHTSFALSTLFPQGKVKEALRELHAALRADPLSPQVRGELAWVQVSAGRYDEAIENCRRVLAVAPESLHEKQVLTRALFLKGEVTEAMSLLDSRARFNDGVRGYIYAKTGRRSEAEELAMSNARFPARTSLIYAGLGDKRRTFEALEEMAANGEPRAGIHLTYPELAMIRDDPRLKAFRKRLGLS